MGELLLMRSRPTGRTTGSTGVAVDGAAVPTADRVTRAVGVGAAATGRAGRSGPRDRTVRYARLRRLRDRASASVRGDLGMATAEYAIATVAAAGFAGLLIAVLRSDEVRGMLAQIVRGALSL
ncbi:DUF4244 domain-containing protein [Actinotalea sp. AC32]|nr:DUF4244 domain-containing protein [Actinotalea sp. AC32]